MISDLTEKKREIQVSHNSLPDELNSSYTRPEVTTENQKMDILLK